MEPTTDQKQRYALRQCYLLAIRMARKAQNPHAVSPLGWWNGTAFCTNLTHWRPLPPSPPPEPTREP
jgi:hypothetical protein